MKGKYFSLLLASAELLRTQHHDEEGASAHSLSAGLWQRESKVASWESDTTVKPLAVKGTCHPQCDPRTLRTWLMHYDKTPKSRRTGVGCFSHMEQEGLISLHCSGHLITLHLKV